jgi:hypothetical protein
VRASRLPVQDSLPPPHTSAKRALSTVRRTVKHVQLNTSIRDDRSAGLTNSSLSFSFIVSQTSTRTVAGQRGTTEARSRGYRVTGDDVIADHRGCRPTVFGRSEGDVLRTDVRFVSVPWSGHLIVFSTFFALIVVFTFFFLETVLRRHLPTPSVSGSLPDHRSCPEQVGERTLLPIHVVCRVSYVETYIRWTFLRRDGV